jgi:hypothetical protein
MGLLGVEGEALMVAEAIDGDDGHPTEFVTVKV